MDLMTLQDQIEQFQKLVFAHFRGSANNECRISSLVPLVKESYGIYKFLTSMLRAMHRRTDAMDALEPLRARYDNQHHDLRRFYYECANLKFLTSLINVPKLNHVSCPDRGLDEAVLTLSHICRNHRTCSTARMPRLCPPGAAAHRPRAPRSVRSTSRRAC